LRELNGGPVLTALQVVVSLILLVVASDAFTNAVEWIGALYGLSRSAVGSVVAAVGSSLPETMIAAVALLVLRSPESQAVGIGAVIGAPLLLGTIAFSAIGILALLRRRPPNTAKLIVNEGVAIFGLTLFVLTFALVIGASFAPTMAVRASASALVIIAYVAYLVFHFRRDEPQSDETPPRLHFQPAAERPRHVAVFAQLAMALIVTVAASRWFIDSVIATSASLQLSPLVVSLFLSPVATELPELLNVSIWMRRGLDELAFGNVLGAMMFQTSIASAIAMLASPWRLEVQAYAACAAGLLGAALMLVSTALRRRVEPVALVACGGFYILYAVVVTFAR